jgi:hypothetical protein
MAEEKVGRHKGAIETLMHEKKELSRLLQIVNKQMERHMKELEEEGVDADQFIQSLTGENSEEQNKNTNSSRKQSQSNRKQNRNEQEQKEEEEEEGTDDFAPF